MNKYITHKSFKDISDVAIHCDMNKLNIAIGESKIFDIEHSFCDTFFDIFKIWDEILDGDENLVKKTLISGGIFDGCQGRKLSTVGFEKVWVYFAYSRYLLLNNFNDTPNGNVKKSNDFSFPTPFKDVLNFSNKYRDMALSSVKGLNNFICKNNDILQLNIQCESCTCPVCSNESKAVGWSVKTKTIKKPI